MEEEEKESRKELKEPDTIYVETEDYEPGREFGGFQKEFQHSYEKMGARSYPISVRVVCLFCSLFILFFLLLATPFLLFFLGVNILTLFQWDAFKQRTKVIWFTYSKMLVTALGLLVAVLSPALGISIILVYFMMQGQKSEDVWVERIFRASKKQ